MFACHVYSVLETATHCLGIKFRVDVPFQGFPDVCRAIFVKFLLSDNLARIVDGAFVVFLVGPAGSVVGQQHGVVVVETDD